MAVTPPPPSIEVEPVTRLFMKEQLMNVPLLVLSAPPWPSPDDSTVLLSKIQFSTSTSPLARCTRMAPPIARELFASMVTPASPSITRVLLRSEEHTSELQSRPHLVCRLL